MFRLFTKFIRYRTLISVSTALIAPIYTSTNPTNMYYLMHAMENKRYIKAQDKNIEQRLHSSFVLPSASDIIKINIYGSNYSNIYLVQIECQKCIDPNGQCNRCKAKNKK